MRQSEMWSSLVPMLKGFVLDGIKHANSGHPGGAMSSMDMAAILFSEYLRFDPEKLDWFGRDRFILSAGHESMLLYSLLYGWDLLSLKDLQNFRKIHSITPGHPEYPLTPGVEVSTGPLGQGAAMSIGMAIGSQHLEAVFGADLFQEQRIWVLLGDGCMQEDVTYGAASLAGHLKLGNLIWIYDQNRVQISGPIQRATSNDEAKIYEGLGWQTLTIDGHDHKQIRNAYDQALKTKDKPTLIIAQTTMAKGAATLEGQAKAHGTPFSKTEYENTKKKLGLSSDQDFDFPLRLKELYQNQKKCNQDQRRKWDALLNSKKEADPSFAKKWHDQFHLPKDLPSYPLDPEKKNWSTRSAFGKLLWFWAPHLPGLIGGSADLEPSNMTEEFAHLTKDFTSRDRLGRNLAFGVREFPMSCITNGLALYGGFLPFDGTFLTFSDYSRPAIRLGALQKAKVIHELTHDSFYLGEDGPTHQPVEHLMSLRLIPDLYVIRPADFLETQELLKRAFLEWTLPSAFCLSRQDLPLLSQSPMTQDNHPQYGAWKVYGQEYQTPHMVIYGTGSEVSLAIEVAKKLKENYQVTVVSVPSFELFAESPKDYQDRILMKNHQTLHISIEAGSSLGWERWVGSSGLIISLDRFGLSGSPSDLAQEFGFTVEVILKKILSRIHLLSSLR